MIASCFRESLLLTSAMGLYLLALISYVLLFAVGARAAGAGARAAAWLGLLVHTGALVLRGLSAGRAPMVSLYGYLLTFSWMVVLCYLVFEIRTGRVHEQARAAGAPALLLAVTLLGYATTLPAPSRQAETLAPLLRSNWLLFHVSTAVVAYGAAGLASVLACLYFVSYAWGKRVAWWRDRLPSAASLDRAVYGAVRVSFPFLTLVLLTGAVWGYQAWGRYWEWDPKETWSLVTWMVYAFYLHARRANWRAPRANAVVVVGLLALLFTFLGVSRLAPFANSLHAYGGG